MSRLDRVHLVHEGKMFAEITLFRKQPSRDIIVYSLNKNFVENIRKDLQGCYLKQVSKVKVVFIFFVVFFLLSGKPLVSMAVCLKTKHK